MLTVRRRVRREAFPENQIYRDTGYSLRPTCLSCDLPKCRYDYRYRFDRRGMDRLKRNEEICRLRKGGLSVKDLAEDFDLAQRTIIRITSSEREQRDSSSA